MRPYGDPRTLEQRRLKAIRLFAKGLARAIAGDQYLLRSFIHATPLSLRLK